MSPTNPAHYGIGQPDLGLCLAGIQLREQGIELTVENGCDEGAAVLIDLLKLRRIFANIISNSVRHAGVSSLRIDITARIEDSKVIFTIADNGHGVGREDLKHIFKPFYTSFQ